MQSGRRECKFDGLLTYPEYVVVANTSTDSCSQEAEVSFAISGGLIKRAHPYLLLSGEEAFSTSRGSKCGPYRTQGSGRVRC